MGGTGAGEGSAGVNTPARGLPDWQELHNQAPALPESGPPHVCSAVCTLPTSMCSKTHFILEKVTHLLLLFAESSH